MNSVFYALHVNNQSKIFREITASKLQGQQAAYSISVDMKIYALLLKHNSTAGFPIAFCQILEQFFRESFWGAASEKKTEEEKDPQ